MLEDPSSDPGRATQRCQHTQVSHTAEAQVRGSLNSKHAFTGTTASYRRKRDSFKPAIRPGGHQRQSGHDHQRTTNDFGSFVF